MDTAAAGSEAAHPRIRWTPSDAVLLHPELFAPLPPPPQKSALAAEWDVHGTPIGWGVAVLLIGAAWLIWPPESADGPAWPWGVGLLLGGVACLAFWRYQRQKVDPCAVVAQSGTTWLLGHRVRVDVALWSDQVLIAALLAREAAGHLQIARVIEDGDEVVRLRARPGSEGAWPHDALEDRLRPMGADDLASVVADWLAGPSYNPRGRAIRLLQHSLVSRGLGGYLHYDQNAHRSGGLTVADAYGQHGWAEVQRDAAPVDDAWALLERCQRERPELWAALRRAIDQGLDRRRLQPEWEQRGQASVQTYPHAEPPLESLDAVPAPAAQDLPDEPESLHHAPPASLADPEPSPAAQAPVSGATPDLPSTVTLQPPAGPAWLVGAVVVAVLAVVLPPSGLHEFLHSAAAVVGLVFALGATAFEAWQVGAARRRTAARAAAGFPEPTLPVHLVMAQLARKPWHGVALVGVVHGTLAALAARWGVNLLDVLGLVLLLAAQAGLWAWRQSVSPADAVRAVSARLAALQQARRAASLADGAGGHGWATGSSAPAGAGMAPLAVQITEGDALPDPSSEGLAWLQRPLLRRRALYRLHWWSTGLLLVGGGACTGALVWAAQVGRLPLPLNAAETVFVLFMIATALPLMAGLALKTAFFDPEGALSPWLPRWVAACARVALLALAWHWGGWAGAGLAVGVAVHLLGQHLSLRRLGRRLPVPVPARLTLLRVFGAASFEDFRELIAPWRGVGLVEYLEGQDSVGESADVQAAVAEGRLEDVLALTEADVQRRLAATSVAPDDDLHFGSLSFQCANDVWQPAVQAMLDRSDAVVMDLTALSPSNAGCAWELGQLLDRVPLSRVTLLVNDNTDLHCLNGILADCAAHIAASSPNRDDRGDRTPVWRVLRIGGYAQRQGGESYFQWRRRLSHRLDSTLLTAHLLATAQPLRSQLPAPPPPPRPWQGAWDRVSPWRTGVVLVLAGLLAGQL